MSNEENLHPIMKISQEHEKQEIEAIHKLIRGSLLYALSTIYMRMYKPDKDFDQFYSNINKSEVIANIYPGIREVVQQFRVNKEKNYFGDAVFAYLDYNKVCDRIREENAMHVIGNNENEPCPEMDRIFKLLHFKYGDNLYCMDFKLNASYQIKVTPDFKFLEIKDGSRISCVLVCHNRREAYELFELSESNPIVFNDQKFTIYGVRFNTPTKDLGEIYSRVVTPNTRLVKNRYLNE